MQLAIAAGFLSFAGAWLASPEALEQAFARDPVAQLPVVPLALGALAMHAIAAGLFAAFRRFNSWTYPGFALSFLPVFAADYWLYAVSGAFNEMAVVHAGGMIVILALCVCGFRLSRRDEAVRTA